MSRGRDQPLGGGHWPITGHSLVSASEKNEHGSQFLKMMDCSLFIIDTFHFLQFDSRDIFLTFSNCLHQLLSVTSRQLCKNGIFLK